jgi:hypothetical protein
MTGTNYTPATHPTDWTTGLQEPPIPRRAIISRAAAERCEQEAQADAGALFFLDGGDDFLKACALVGEIQSLTARPGARLPEKIARLAAEVQALRLAWEAWRDDQAEHFINEMKNAPCDC